VKPHPASGKNAPRRPSAPVFVPDTTSVRGPRTFEPRGARFQ
jgi:hypothetical protein